MGQIRRLANTTGMHSLMVVASYVVLALVVGSPSALAQAVYPLPYASVAVGLAPGTTAAICSGALDSLGDGCPGTQASMASAGIQGAWTDSHGNVYFGDYSDYRLRVLYRGGTATAAVIAANNPTITTPQVGYVYSIGGGTAATITSAYCNGGSSGATSLDLGGSGCPAYEAYVKPTSGAVDAAGNIFYREGSAGSWIRVIYAGVSTVANLITTEVPAVTSPMVGSVYRIAGNSAMGSGFSGNGGLATGAQLNNPHSLTLDSSDNIYVAETSNNVVRLINASTGFISTYAGGNGGSNTAGFSGDGGVATSAELSAPYDVALDINNNLYIADSANAKIRVVYHAGTIFGSGSFTAGDIYTVAGGGSGSSSGTAPTGIQFTTPRGVSLDGYGNLYVSDYGGNKIWQLNGSTGIGIVYAGGGSALGSGVHCSGSSGPVTVDTVEDGCAAPQIKLGNPETKLAFDPWNASYVADYNNAMIRAFTFNGQFASTAVGSAAPSYFVAVSGDVSSFTAPYISISTQGSATGEFTGSASTCTAGTAYSSLTVCAYTLTFAPVSPGTQKASYQLTNGSTVYASGDLSGDGLHRFWAFLPVR